MKLLKIAHLRKFERAFPRSGYYWDLTRRARRTAILKVTLGGRGEVVHLGKHHILNKGRAVLMFSSEDTQYFVREDADVPWEFCWMNMDDGSGQFDAIRDQFGSFFEIDLEGRAMDLFFEICDAYVRRSFANRYQESAILYRFTMALFEELSSPGSQYAPMEAAKDFLADHHRSYINVKEVAERFNLSREHFNRTFREHHGITPGRFLREERLKTAKRLLETTNLSVEDVAAQIGSASASAFCRMFKEVSGLTPGAWRRGRL